MPLLWGFAVLFWRTLSWPQIKIDVCLSGDCVSDATVAGCSTFSNTPAPATGRRRRAILSQKVRREAPVNNGEITAGGEISVDKSDCEVQEVDGNLVTCKQQRNASSSAKTFGLSVLTGTFIAAQLLK